MNFRLSVLRLLEQLGFREKSFRVQQVAEVPDNPRPFEVYAIGDSHIWQAALLCPCGCGHLIQLSPLKSDSPRWELNVDRDGNATMSRTLGCQAHFLCVVARLYGASIASSSDACSFLSLELQSLASERCSSASFPNDLNTFQHHDKCDWHMFCLD